MIKGKSPEEIRKTFNIQNDFTPEEEDQIRRENEWAEEYVSLPINVNRTLILHAAVKCLLPRSLDALQSSFAGTSWLTVILCFGFLVCRWHMEVMNNDQARRLHRMSVSFDASLLGEAA